MPLSRTTPDCSWTGVCPPCPSPYRRQGSRTGSSAPTAAIVPLSSFHGRRVADLLLSGDFTPAAPSSCRASADKDIFADAGIAVIGVNPDRRSAIPPSARIGLCFPLYADPGAAWRKPSARPGPC